MVHWTVDGKEPMSVEQKERSLVVHLVDNWGRWWVAPLGQLLVELKVVSLVERLADDSVGSLAAE